MSAWCAAAWKRDEGQAFVEYSLILALVAAGLFAVLLLFRDSLGNSYDRMGDRVDSSGLPVATPGGSKPGGTTPGGATPGGEIPVGGVGGGGPGYPGAGKGGRGDHGCGGGQGGGSVRGGGGGCGGGGDRDR
jgi:Flp pilus assembly pilin Flp